MAFEYPQGGAPALTVITTHSDGKVSARPGTEDDLEDAEADPEKETDETVEEAVGSHEALDSFMRGEDVD